MTTDKAWRTWGSDDPYFGVLSHDKFRRTNIDAHKEEFFALGVRDVSAVLARYQRVFGALQAGSALDFGSGVGRLTLALAARFDRAVGLDISPGMLDEARANAEASGRTNATFALSDSALSGAPGQFDFVNSYIVLQHISPSRGLPLIQALLAKVAPGGGCMIHVSVQRRKSLARHIAYWAKFNVPLANPIINALSGRPLRDAPMQMNEYPLPVILAMFKAAGMGEIVCVPDDHGDVLTVSLISHRPAS